MDENAHPEEFPLPNSDDTIPFRGVLPQNQPFIAHDAPPQLPEINAMSPTEQPSSGIILHNTHESESAEFSGMAISSFVLSLFSLALFGLILTLLVPYPVVLFLSTIAIILGFVALHTIRASHGTLKGRTVAIAGIIIGFLPPIFTIAILAFFIFALSNSHFH